MKLKFSGHDTFPLRYGWLFKAVNLLFNNENKDRTADETARDAIVRLGVGRNMVNAIKYWAETSWILESNLVSGRNVQELTPLGRFLFSIESGEQSGVDPYLEDIGSIWLIHFSLNFRDDSLTSYRYFFNHCNFQQFEKGKLVDEVYSTATSLTGLEPGKKSTVKKDVDCFLHTYTKKTRSNKSIDEDHFASPLAELGLVREISSGYLVSELSSRKSLPTKIFSYALCKFIQRETENSNVNRIDFDSILTKPGSPGRIFRLSEQGLSSALDESAKDSNNRIAWTDSSGLRQIMIDKKYKEDPEEYLLQEYYGGGRAYY
ncbi:DUF4007 family protein [Pseudidiomarina sp. 1APP75-32.1]|uniref:DUF4007 family protein n=1 Tax=Pseudidiomarina terrestris TaxID=2820060 RepID=A0AAW7QXG6_9GAMM|nr:DUF4007 family protein [Pseudidiomarina sp. 1APP75-32.1]MDN7124867.1 DUF4007 family protein [Pseudidiomarina sp. 1APP75-32.1]